jgi:hypothetical protein
MQGLNCRIGFYLLPPSGFIFNLVARNYLTRMDQFIFRIKTCRGEIRMCEGRNKGWE